jgi:hypothetical protein
MCDCDDNDDGFRECALCGATMFLSDGCEWTREPEETFCWECLDQQLATANATIEELRKRVAELELLEAYVESLPTALVLRCRDYILAAETRAQCSATVAKTSTVMERDQIEECLRTVWQCSEVLKAGLVDLVKHDSELDRLRKLEDAAIECYESQAVVMFIEEHEPDSIDRERAEEVASRAAKVVASIASQAAERRKADS